MPELPEVETTRRGISPHIEGKKLTTVIIRQHSLRWPIPKELPQLLEKKLLKDIQRRGKYLLFRFTSGHMLIHLGMSGSLRIVDPKELQRKHDHVDFIFSRKTCLRFHDPRRFGAILWTDEPLEEHKLLTHLGPEPLSPEFNLDYLFAKSRQRKKDIKTFIMDSKIVVGVGNIYANEALFDAGIRPTKPAGKVSKKQYEKLITAIKQVLERSIIQGGTTLRDFVGGDGQPGYFVQQLNVYGREGLACKKCSKTLKAIRQSQRITVYCSHCQS
ncbi:MAG: bifunctional DNA-formamidopyrimidine glycosylase/DNA-(apurinic or apyrimidinic site) lyase [Cellvibrionaceae bacterium]